MRAVFDLKVKVKRCIVQWCNGSTTGFGSVCGGSNPPWTTKNYSLKTNYYGKSIFIRR